MLHTQWPLLHTRTHTHTRARAIIMVYAGRETDRRSCICCRFITVVVVVVVRDVCELSISAVLTATQTKKYIPPTYEFTRLVSTRGIVMTTAVTPTRLSFDYPRPVQTFTVHRPRALLKNDFALSPRPRRNNKRTSVFSRYAVRRPRNAARSSRTNREKMIFLTYV